MAQGQAQKIDPGTVAAMALTEEAPFTRLDGGPLGTRGQEIWANGDGTIQTGVWECDAGRFHANFAAYGEQFHVIAGELICTPDGGGEAFTLRAGDSALFPRGWTGEWDVRVPLRKVYALWQHD